MHRANLIKRSRDLTILIVVNALSLVFAGCSSSTAPKATAISGLWVANNGGSVVQYTTAQLGGLTSGAASTVLGTGGTGIWGVAFDRDGNLWTTNTNGPILEFAAGLLKASGTPTPAVTLSAAGLNYPSGLAFDAHGNLWVANSQTNTVVKYSPSQLSASGSPTPAVTISSSGGPLDAPTGIAFDAHGNLWVANQRTSALVEFTPSQLTASGSPTPAVTLTSLSMDAPLMVAFDATGNLWVDAPSPSTLLAFSPSQLASSGSVIPMVTLTPAVSRLAALGGLAFDGDGNLWVADFSQSQLLEFTASQVATSGSPTPSVIISGSSLFTPIGLAFNPSVSGLPIR